MPCHLPLLKGSITLSAALDEDDNMLPPLAYDYRRHEFLIHLWDYRQAIAEIVSFHLHCDYCEVSDIDEWMGGSYNVCLPVYITHNKDEKVIIRIPLSYRLGETQRPGSVDEKLRCEAATYIWMKTNCPDVSIPFLYGCGFSNGQTLTPNHLSPLCYESRHHDNVLKLGYLIISFVTEGKLLSDSWIDHCHEKERLSNLFHDLARATLAMNRTTFSHIGSLTVDERGQISLSNRPLTQHLLTLENENIPTELSNDTIYSEVEQYFLDLLRCHDNRIRYQPNSIISIEDGRQQLAALTMMRAILPHFTMREYSRGPFMMTLTDLHNSNVFVDDDWHITMFIDLEWACILPVYLQFPPHWLTGRAIDQLGNEGHLAAFSQRVDEYLDAFRDEERKSGKGTDQALLKRRSWERGIFWYLHALNSPKGLYNIFNQHIQPRFHPEHNQMQAFDQIVAQYWAPDRDTDSIIEEKLIDKEAYEKELRELFEHDDR